MFQGLCQSSPMILVECIPWYFCQLAMGIFPSSLETRQIISTSMLASYQLASSGLYFLLQCKMTATCPNPSIQTCTCRGFQLLPKVQVIHLKSCFQHVLKTHLLQNKRRSQKMFSKMIWSIGHTKALPSTNPKRHRSISDSHVKFLQYYGSIFLAVSKPWLACSKVNKVLLIYSRHIWLVYGSQSFYFIFGGAVFSDIFVKFWKVILNSKLKLW